MPHIHHGYIGALLIIWSSAVILFRAFMVGDYNPWLAWGGLVLGVGLLAHDLLWHLRDRRTG